MKAALWDSDWLTALARNYSLPESVIRRLLEEFLAVTELTPEQYVAQRHLTLRAAGLSNTEIYQVLKAEVDTGRFQIPSVTLRQIRRWIYG